VLGGVETCSLFGLQQLLPLCWPCASGAGR
jgi:hypothetical protein